MSLRLRTDWVLFGVIVALVFFGLVMVYSASSVMAEVKLKVSSVHFFVRQLGWAVLSFCFLMYFKRKDYLDLKSPAWAFLSLGAVLVMLIAVYFADPRAHRWFRIGGIGSIQPSEFAKPALILFLAYFITQRSRSVNDRHTIIQAGLALAVLALTVVVADLGTAMVLAGTAGVLFYVAGLERRYLVVAVVCLILFAAIAIAFKPYRVQRIIAALDPEYKILNVIDPKGYIKQYANESITTHDAGYQAWQSRVAVGSGGALGLGLMKGRHKNGFLPEAHTDFIYAVVGEETGLWGCSAVLAGFMIILWRGFRLCWIAGDEFGRYLALGVTSSIVIQALINMSVVLDMGPTKGIPLPMISFGGSSLLSTLLCLGMLMSVSGHTE
jgi:cell division protein FtsW